MTRYLETNEAAELARVTRGTIYRYIREGRLPTHRIGKKYLIEENELRTTIMASTHKRPSFARKDPDQRTPAQE